MNKFAVIDIGSNSVRLMYVADGKVLYKDLETTRLGEGLAQTKALNPLAIERSALAVQTFYNRAIAQGAEKVFAFATAAVRTANNGNDFVSRVAQLCPLEVDVISGDKEAELGILGALGERDGGVIDVGGASTEFVVKQNGAYVYKKSVDIGVVRLKDDCGRDKPYLLKKMQSAIEAFGSIPKNVTVYAIGGTATTLAALCLRLEKYDSKKVTGAEIMVETMSHWAEKLLEMDVEEIAKFPCMPPKRADVIAGGALWLYTFMRAFGIEKIIVSDRDNLEGYAIKKGLL